HPQWAGPLDPARPRLRSHPRVDPHHRLTAERCMTQNLLDGKCPSGPIGERWSRHKGDLQLIGPINKRKYHVIVVGTGLAGAAAAATLGELGYRVTAITYHDSPRRAHSVAAQGGINAAKN